MKMGKLFLKFAITLMSVFLVTCLIGCNQYSGKGSEIEEDSAPSTEGEQGKEEQENKRDLVFLDTQLVKGEQKNSLITRIGEPDEVDGNRLIFYAWNPNLIKNANRGGLYAIAVYIKDGKVDYWTKLSQVET